MTFSNEKRNVVLGITGSIAAYKGAEVARLLVSRGYSVRVIMSGAAQEFIGALTFESITGHPVLTSFWEESGKEGIAHIELASWADAVVIAPATADTLAKMTGGFADSPLTAIVLATRAPIVVAPAMNCNMYEHPTTQENLRRLKERGVIVVEPEIGALACVTHGAGRLADPWEIFSEIRKALFRHDFAGKRFVITTGATREAVDGGTYLSSCASGRMGVELAREAFRRGADVTLIHGDASVKVPRAVRCLPARTSDEMQAAVLRAVFEEQNGADVIMTAAVPAAYRAAGAPASNKRGAVLELTPVSDVMQELAARRGEAAAPLLVGFASESGELEDLLQKARERVRDQHIDMLVAKFGGESGEPESSEVVWLVNRTGKENQVATSYKSRVASQILDAISGMM